MSPLKSWSERRKEADAEGAKFAPLVPDRYSFVIVDDAKVEEKDGNARFKINPAVESGERAKARVFHTFYESEKPAGMRYFFEQMDAVGLGSDFFDREPTNEQIAKALKGRRFTAEVYNDEWEGKVSQKLRKFAPAVGSAPAAGGPGAGPAAPAQGPGPAAQSFGQAPVQQAAPAQQFAQPQAQQFAPVQQQAPAQQYAQPLQQAAPLQQAPAQEQFQQPLQQAAVAPQPQQQAAAADNPWATPTTELAPPPFIQ